MTKQVFSIYCHQDADGGIAAAIFGLFILNKYKKYGWDINIIPINHSPNTTEWVNQDISFPCAILDFSLHPHFLNERFFLKKQYWLKILGNEDFIPKCYWIDHHATGSSYAFISEKNTKDMIKNAVVVWDTMANSTPGIFRKYYKELGIERSLIEEYEEYIDYGEIIDGALYATAEGAHDFSSFIVKLNALFSVAHPCIDPIAFFKKIVMTILGSSNPNTLFSADPLFPAVLEFERELHNLRFASYTKFTKCIKKVAVADFRLEDNNPGISRFIPYLLFPEVEYAIHIIPYTSEVSAISCGINPWKKPQKSAKHLGEYFAENFDGGGHSFVAGGKIAQNNTASLEALISYLTS